MSAEDISEIEQLLTMCHRDNTKALLNNELSRLKSLSNATNEIKTNVPLPSIAPVKIQPAETVSDAPEKFVTISDICWDQDSNRVILYFMDGFQGIGNVPKENITCNFTKNSVLLEIRNFKGKNYRYFLKNTEHSIKPDKSSMKVGKNRISIYLVKEQSENWVSLVASNFSAPVPKPSANADPSASIMEMMKNLYENGDDEMKRTIQKSFYESQQKMASGEMPDMAGMPDMSKLPKMN